jgi:predicted HicB family RNase H-like nuclease
MKGRGTTLRTKTNRSKVRSVVQSVRLSKEERRALRSAASGQGVSVSDYVRALLNETPTFRAELGR